MEEQFEDYKKEVEKRLKKIEIQLEKLEYNQTRLERAIVDRLEARHDKLGSIVDIYNKTQIGKEVMDIILFHLDMLKMKPTKENVKLATTMFAEGAQYWKERGLR